MSDTPRASGQARGRHVLVLGGGLAGIAAGLRLSDAGYRVTLLESRKRLGGRAGSHVDPRSGEMLDNCQHILLKCCTELMGLYERLGVSQVIDGHDTLHFLDRKGHHDVMRRNMLPAPMHLSTSMLRFHSLSWKTKWALARATMAMLRHSPDEQRRWEGRTFGEWLAAHNQSAEAIERFWDPIVTSALNETVRCADAISAIQVFRQGFLDDRNAYCMGVASVPLGRLYEPAARIIGEAGGEVRFGTSAAKVHFDGRQVSGIETSDGQVLTADRYVSALPVENLLRIVPTALQQADERFGRLHELQFNPILGVHLWLEHAAMDLPHAALLDSPLHWVFNRGIDSNGRQHLHVVISAAHEWMSREPDAILDQVREELAVFLPKMNKGTSTGKVIKERRATFALRPGVEAIRPEAGGATENLLLAGDFCKTGWPATMEGAVRSGNLAAAIIGGDSSR